MDAKPDNSALVNPEDLRAFLLGKLPQRETALMEERLIEDEAFFGEVRSAEEELIDEYALGTLSQAEQELVLLRCERQPEWARRVAMRKAFFAVLSPGARQQPNQVLTRSSRKASSFSRRFRFLLPGLAIAVSLLLVACGLLLRERRTLKLRLAQMQQARLSVPVRKLQTPLDSSAVSELFFPQYVVRGEDRNATLRMNESPVRLVEFQLELPQGFAGSQRWNVTITGRQGVVFLQNGLQKQQVQGVSFVKLSLYSNTLDPGTYSVQLLPAHAITSNATNRWALAVTQ